MNQEAQSLAVEQQEERYVGDSWEEKISKYVAGKPSVTFSQLFCELGFEDKDQTPVQQQRLGKIMKKLGWMKSRGRKGEARFAVFKPPDLKHFQF